MKKLFVIPGFTHRASDKTYQWLKCDLKGRFEVIIVPIDWNYKVMSDYIAQFSKEYENRKGRKNYVLGFSFGAMIALLSAKTLKPDKLFLCSLSPYFCEDLGVMKSSWKRFIGKRRVEDFKTHKANNATKGLRVPTQVFIGEVESLKFPRLRYRCQETAKRVNSELVVVPDAPHDITHPNYQKAIRIALDA